MAKRNKSRASHNGDLGSVSSSRSDHSMVSESDTSLPQKYDFPIFVDDVQELTQQVKKDCGALLFKASPSYTVLERKTELLLNTEENEVDYPRPNTVANSALDFEGHRVSWSHHRTLGNIGQNAIPKKQYEPKMTEKRSNRRSINDLELDRKQKSELILEGLRQDGYLHRKGGVAFSIHFCNEQKSPSPPVLIKPQNWMTSDYRRERDHINNRASTIIDQVNQCCDKRERILERLLMSSHRTTSSTERQKEDKVDKTIRLNDKKRRKAAAKARKQKETSSDPICAKTSESKLPLPISTPRLKSSKARKDQKSRRN